MSNYSNYKNKIIKSTDSQFDFLGLQGLYFFILLGGVGLSFVLLMIMGNLDIGSFVLIGTPVVIITVTYFVCKKMQEKYGAGGYSAIVESTIPRDIKVNVDKQIYERLK